MLIGGFSVPSAVLASDECAVPGVFTANSKVVEYPWLLVTFKVSLPATGTDRVPTIRVSVKLVTVTATPLMETTGTAPFLGLNPDPSMV